MDAQQWSLLALMLQIGTGLIFGVAVLSSWRRANIENLRHRAEDAEKQVAVLKLRIEDLQNENFDLANKITRVEEQNKRLGRKTLDQQDLIDELERRQKILITSLEAHGIRLDALEHAEE